MSDECVHAQAEHTGSSVIASRNLCMLTRSFIAVLLLLLLLCLQGSEGMKGLVGTRGLPGIKGMTGDLVSAH